MYSSHGAWIYPSGDQSQPLLTEVVPSECCHDDKFGVPWDWCGCIGISMVGIGGSQAVGAFSDTYAVLVQTPTQLLTDFSEVQLQLMLLLQICRVTGTTCNT